MLQYLKPAQNIAKTTKTNFNFYQMGKLNLLLNQEADVEAEGLTFETTNVQVKILVHVWMVIQRVEIRSVAS